MGPDSTECLTPKQIEELLYASNTPGAETAPTHPHLAICPRCREEFEEQRRFACVRQGFAQLPGTPPEARPPLLPGYDQFRYLGRGGCGDVWHARYVECGLIQQ